MDRYNIYKHQYHKMSEMTYKLLLNKRKNVNRCNSGALDREKGPGAPAGEPRRGGFGLLCAMKLHRADKDRDVFCFFLHFLYNHFLCHIACFSNLSLHTLLYLL